VPGVEIFHSGTALKDGQIVTSGGRVLAVSAVGETLEQALERAYQAMGDVRFEGMYFRKDIGHRTLKKQ
jgi:phosphoribosylamine--glycine ligase